LIANAIPNQHHESAKPSLLRMTEPLPTPDKRDREEPGLNWSRITAISFAIALHIAALMLLLVPVTPPGAEQEEEQNTTVVIIEPPPKPPEPPPPPPEPPKEIKLTPQEVPRETPPEPQPEPPPVIFDEPSPMAEPAPPPVPPAPPTPPAPTGPPRNDNDLRASLCVRPSLAPLQQAASRAGVAADLALMITYQADGTITNVDIVKSSRNRDLDRAAQTWAKRAKLCPGSAGQGRLPFSFATE
jgi:protein TonB